MGGPLKGLRVIEFSGLGPAPLAGQLLCDLGAEVICIERATGPVDPTEVNRRGKRSVVLDLKSEKGLEAARRLIDSADVVIEGFRPGVMERLGLGPAACPDHVIFARMTGWGQDGPLAQSAGHDLNYLALTGALYMMGEPGKPPVPPLNLVADYGGGTMFLIMGILSALFERAQSGKGQVVDAAMVDGVPAMMGLLQQLMARGDWTGARGANMLDGGAPYYRCYGCKCGGFLSVGCLEPQFFAEFLKLAELPVDDADTQYDRATWPGKTARYAARIAEKTRDEWAMIFEGTDACVAPVLTPSEAAQHPHNLARGTFFERGALQTAPAPRFSRSVPGQPAPPVAPGADTDDIMREIGLAP